MGQGARTTRQAGWSAPPALPRSDPRSGAGEIVDHDWMLAHRDAWDALAREAASPNPFFAATLIDAHVASGLMAPPSYAVVRTGERLLAVLPVASKQIRFGWLRHAASAAASPYMVSATPLIGRDAPEAVFDALLGAVGEMDGPGLLVLPLLRLDDLVGEGLVAAAKRRHWSTVLRDHYARAVLDRRASYDAFAAELPSLRRKDLRRRRRRLSELGGLAFVSADAEPGLGEAMDAFLALEASGWKGARRTALASRSETKAYAHALIASSGGPVTIRIDRLLLDGRTIAASLALVSGGTAYLYKSAYDETLARHAPGVILEDEIVRALHQTRFAERLNSASVAGGLLDSLYPDREQVGDLIVSTDPSLGQARLDEHLAQDGQRRRLLAHAKEFYWTIRQLRSGRVAR